jgi:hypothetical protein
MVKQILQDMISCSSSLTAGAVLTLRAFPEGELDRTEGQGCTLHEQIPSMQGTKKRPENH